MTTQEWAVAVAAFAAIVATAALFVSIGSAVASYRLSKQQNAVQERLLALETTRDQAAKLRAQSAELRAAITYDGQIHRLVIGNEGAATARNVTVSLDEMPMMQNQLVLRGQTEVTKLGPGARANYLLGVASQSPDVLDVRLSWEDDTGQPRAWESQLKLV